jgi:hypothetical protein
MGAEGAMRSVGSFGEPNAKIAAQRLKAVIWQAHAAGLKACPDTNLPGKLHYYSKSSTLDNLLD